MARCLAARQRSLAARGLRGVATITMVVAAGTLSDNDGQFWLLMLAAFHQHPGPAQRWRDGHKTDHQQINHESDHLTDSALNMAALRGRRSKPGGAGLVTITNKTG